MPMHHASTVFAPSDAHCMLATLPPSKLQLNCKCDILWQTGGTTVLQTSPMDDSTACYSSLTHHTSCRWFEKLSDFGGFMSNCIPYIDWITFNSEKCWEIMPRWNLTDKTGQFCVCHPYWLKVLISPIITHGNIKFWHLRMMLGYITGT